MPPQPVVGLGFQGLHLQVHPPQAPAAPLLPLEPVGASQAESLQGTVDHLFGHTRIKQGC